MPQTQEIWNRVYARTDGIIAREIAGEMLLVPVRGRVADMQRIFALDPTPQFIWEQLDGEKTLRAVLDAVLEAFDVEEEQAAADLLKFTDELLEAGLVAAVDDAAPCPLKADT